MPQLTPAQARVVDAVLTNVAQGYQNAELVGGALFPSVPVGLRGGKIITFGKEAFQLYNTARAPGSNTARMQLGFASGSYAVIDYSLEAVVPIELQQEAEAGPGVNLTAAAVRTVQDTLALQLEKAQADLATTAANYDAAHKNVALAGATLFSDLTNSDPIGVIETAKDAVRQTIGRYPNTVVLGAQVMKSLRQHSKILDRIKYTGRDVPTAELLASLFGVQRVLVGGAVYADTAGTFTDVWGKNVVLAYTEIGGIADAGRPSYGYSYRLRGAPYVEPGYNDRNTKSWMYPVTDVVAPVIASSIAGYLISPAVA